MLYLATVIDLYSRKVVGWSMNNRMKAELVNKALLMAVWQRKPYEGLVWHTDRVLTFKSSIKNEKISFSQKFVLILILLPITLPSEFYY